MMREFELRNFGRRHAPCSDAIKHLTERRVHNNFPHVGLPISGNRHSSIPKMNLRVMSKKGASEKGRTWIIFVMAVQPPHYRKM